MGGGFVWGFFVVFFFNTEFSKMFKSSKVKISTELFSYLTFGIDYQNRLCSSPASKALVHMYLTTTQKQCSSTGKRELLYNV